MTNAQIKPAVARLIIMPLGLSRREKKEKEKCWLWTTSLKLVWRWTQDRAKLQKNTFGHVTNFHHILAFPNMFLKHFCAFKAARPIKSSGYGEVWSQHIRLKDTSSTYEQILTIMNAFISHTSIHTSHEITIKISATKVAVRLKGGHPFDALHL